MFGRKARGRNLYDDSVKPVRKPENELDLIHVPLTSREFVKAFYDSVDQHLVSDETVLGRLIGREQRDNHALKHAMFVATEKRVLMATKVWLSLNIRSVPYTQISSVSTRGFMQSRLEIATSSEKLAMMHPAGDVSQFLAVVNGKLAS